MLRLGRPALALRFPLLPHDCGNRIANSIELCGTESSPAETEVPNVYVSFVWCFVLEKPLEVNKYPACEKPRNYCLYYKLQFSEVVMNVLCEIAWGIIRDTSGFILKKRGELHQDDFN